MLLQTNSYIVPKDKRAEHARLMRRFRQVLARLGCDMFEVYEQVGTNWGSGESNGRYVQIMRFRDRKHQTAVQGAERNDPAAQALIAEFCELVNFPYQQQQGFFAVGFYTSVLPVAPTRVRGAAEEEAEGEAAGPEAAAPEQASGDGAAAHAAAPAAAVVSGAGHEAHQDERPAPVGPAAQGQEVNVPVQYPAPAAMEAAADEHHALAITHGERASVGAAAEDELSDLHFGGPHDPEPEEIAAAGPPLDISERVEVTRREPYGDDGGEEPLSEEELLDELAGHGPDEHLGGGGGEHHATGNATGNHEDGGGDDRLEDNSAANPPRRSRI